MSIDGTLLGAIDITFVKPDRAVDIIVFYKEHSVTNFKQSYASSSPFRLISLGVGTQYDIQLAGQAANGNVGPRSALITVSIPVNLQLVTGNPAIIMIDNDHECPEPMLITGPRGLQGLQGIQGPPGIDSDPDIDNNYTIILSPTHISP